MKRTGLYGKWGRSVRKCTRDGVGVYGRVRAKCTGVYGHSGKRVCGRTVNVADTPNTAFENKEVAHYLRRLLFAAFLPVFTQEAVVSIIV